MDWLKLLIKPAKAIHVHGAFFSAFLSISGTEYWVQLTTQTWQTYLGFALLLGKARDIKGHCVSVFDQL